MELILGYEILESYKRLPYKAWFAFAEFIDNSTQSYRNHKTELDTWYDIDDDMLTVEITYSNPTKSKKGNITIKDNAYGMDRDDLQNAMILGRKPLIANERSKYGLGLKTAAFWFGNNWTIHTTQRGSEELLTVTVDIHTILREEESFYKALKKNKTSKVTQFRPSLDIKVSKCKKTDHGTTLVINDLVRSISAQTSRNTVEYLQSIYRVDLQNENLYLEFQKSPLTWSSDEIDERLLSDENGKKFRRNFSFKVNGKTVKGWAGILNKGSKASGGFALLQADRVIVGYPKNYRNSLIFGSEEGGRNDLTNQRLTGELSLDERFGVSHTKDQILFEDNEEDQLDKALYKKLADYKKESNIPHKSRGARDTDMNFDFASAVKSVFDQLNTDLVKDVLIRKSVLQPKALIKTNEETINRVLKSKHKSFTYEIDGIKIVLLVSDNSSPWDPYLIVRPLGGESRITIVLNQNHPYWMQLADNHSRFNFLLSCIYDGVSEWKAGFILNRMDPDTIKIIKDSLLRLELNTL
jgi:Histidine kinase-, DNA gyrase B-, and HSP90-like ATPase